MVHSSLSKTVSGQVVRPPVRWILNRDYVTTITAPADSIICEGLLSGVTNVKFAAVHSCTAGTVDAGELRGFTDYGSQRIEKNDRYVLGFAEKDW